MNHLSKSLILCNNLNEKVQLSIIKLIDIIRKKDYNNVMNQIAVIVNRVQILIEELNKVNQYVSNSISISDINMRLEKVMDALQNEDYYYLSDLLEYELLTLMEEWKKKIENNIVQIN